MKPPRVFLVALAGFLTTVAVVAMPTYPPFEAVLSDNHGHVRWRSAVKPSPESPENWVFRHEVWNLDTDQNCRVVWKPIGLHSLIPPGENIFAESSLPSRPREFDGRLYRSGGSASGETENSTKVYLPEGHKAFVSSVARVFVESPDGLKPVMISGDSSATEHAIHYILTVEGLNELKVGDTIAVSWDVLTLRSEGTIQLVAPLASDGESVDAVRLGVGEAPTLANQSIVRVTGVDGKVLAEAAMPSLIPYKG